MGVQLHPCPRTSVTLAFGRETVTPRGAVNARRKSVRRRVTSRMRRKVRVSAAEPPRAPLASAGSRLGAAGARSQAAGTGRSAPQCPCSAPRHAPRSAPLHPAGAWTGPGPRALQCPEPRLALPRFGSGQAALTGGSGPSGRGQKRGGGRGGGRGPSVSGRGWVWPRPSPRAGRGTDVV